MIKILNMENINEVEILRYKIKELEDKIGNMRRNKINEMKINELVNKLNNYYKLLEEK